MPRRDEGEVKMDDLRHTLVRATDHDLIVLFVDPDLTTNQMDSLEQFADAISDETEATLAILPQNVVSDCRNYSLQDLLSLRAMVDDLITNRVVHLPNIEA
jgi:hypothetical protein